MQSLIEIGLVTLAVIIFLKFAGTCKKFTLSASVKKWIYGLTAVALIALNVLGQGAEPPMWVIGLGFLMVCLFTLALMSETQAKA
ncbi:MAG: hypothetical protein GX295_02530 [Syntrophomonadaceae bacterium]|nr:hypothetical protein [Syntrophomonadaceae bacterium]